MIGARLWEGRFEGEWLFCWLWCVVSIFEKARLLVGTAGLNRRPLDSQSPPGRRQVSPDMAQWALDQPQQSPGVAGCRLKSVHVGSWNGSFAGRLAACRRDSKDCE